MAWEKGKIVGPTGILGSGSYFDLDNPLGANITLSDIAYGLAYDARWGGQCVIAETGERVFFGVADHSVIMCDHAPEELKYPALMHELGEFMLKDMIGPFKARIPEFKVVEKRNEAALMKWLEVPDFNTVWETRIDGGTTIAGAIKHLDKRMMATERRDLTAWEKTDYWEYIGDAEPFPEKIVPRSPEEAALAFRSRFRQYAPPDVMMSMEKAELFAQSELERRLAS